MTQPPPAAGLQEIRAIYARSLISVEGNQATANDSLQFSFNRSLILSMMIQSDLKPTNILGRRGYRRRFRVLDAEAGTCSRCIGWYAGHCKTAKRMIEDGDEGGDDEIERMTTRTA
ncbi:hypothetical protein L1887_39290 [Cichorium endivia]|nr:hypothetical protein L1887_39290 [Cichorium endivia]